MMSCLVCCCCSFLALWHDSDLCSLLCCAQPSRTLPVAMWAKRATHSMKGAVNTMQIGCRLNRGQGSLPSILLSSLFFIPTSINAAWLSVASGLGVLIVPLSYGHTAHLEAAAATTAVVATAAGTSFVCYLLPDAACLLSVVP